MMPPSDHKKEMKSNYLLFCEYLTKIPFFYQIFDENNAHLHYVYKHPAKY